jgi:predicted transcriptional regulator of viral defense system
MQQKLKPSENQRRLYELAEGQGGYFTAKQAEARGYIASKRNYHVGARNWVRERRGIYRLALFPQPERPDLLLWWLWSCDRSGLPQGVYSHRTALSLHDLTDLMPARIDMTVPIGFRRGALIPRVLQLHFSNVPASEVERMEGVPVTAALRAIFDLWQSREVHHDVLRAAFEEGTRKGKITRKQIEAASSNSEGKELIAALRQKITA